MTPVAWRYWKDKFACWEYTEQDLAFPAVPAGTVLHPLYESVQPAWISVKDRLPADTDRVLVVYRAPCRAVGGNRRSVRFAHYAGGQWRFVTAKDSNRRSDRVTHWMPIPSLPKGPVGLPGTENRVLSGEPGHAASTEGLGGWWRNERTEA